MIDLTLNEYDKEKIVKKAKKSKVKTKKKDSFINDSSEEEEALESGDFEWLPKTRSMCRKVLKKDKITPTKKALYNTLLENSRCTKKKIGKQKIHEYLTPSEFNVQ